MSNLPFSIKIRMKGPWGEVEFHHQPDYVPVAKDVRTECVDHALDLYKGLSICGEQT